MASIPVKLMSAHAGSKRHLARYFDSWCTPFFGHFSGTGFVMRRPQPLGLDIPLRRLIADR